MKEVNQVFRQTSETYKAEQEIIKYIKLTPALLEKRIGIKLFNALLKEINKNEQHKYASKIPFQYFDGEKVVEYSLRIK